MRSWKWGPRDGIGALQEETPGSMLPLTTTCGHSEKVAGKRSSPGHSHAGTLTSCCSLQACGVIIFVWATSPCCFLFQPGLSYIIIQSWVTSSHFDLLNSPYWENTFGFICKLCQSSHKACCYWWQIHLTFFFFFLDNILEEKWENADTQKHRETLPKILLHSSGHWLCKLS